MITGRASCLLLGTLLVTACGGSCADMKPCGSWSGTLVAGDGPVTVELSYAWRPSNGLETKTFFQNGIDITGEGHHYRFRWPTDVEFGGERCKVVDLDGDRAPEFLFVQGGTVARVVFLERGGFVFSPDSDELISSGPLVVVDSDGGPHKEFLVRRAIGNVTDVPTAELSYQERRFRWIRGRGFVEVPRKLS